VTPPPPPLPLIHIFIESDAFVQVLNLDFCTLSALPASLGELTALTTLDVEGNLYLGQSLEEIQPKNTPSFPPQLAGLTALRYFNLNSCGLTHVPQVGPLSPASKSPNIEARAATREL
jgi:Leucine-rich repeat (LRR) protein